MKKILITGGHLTPAVAVIEALHKIAYSAEIVFVGRSTALEGTTLESEESRVIRAMGVRFVTINAGRIKRDKTFLALRTLFKIPQGVKEAHIIIQKEKPDLVVSFGGYVALPIAIAAYRFGIPIITHEQTTQPGIANKFIAKLAQVTCVSFPQTSISKQSILTGLPIRESLTRIPKSNPFLLDDKLPLLFITGGSTGAQSVNHIVYKALPKLLPTFAIVHQVGRYSFEKGDLYGQRDKWKHRYLALPYIDSNEYSWLLHHAFLVVGRSGANTVMEVAAFEKIALFIPLPWAARNEQYHNAKFLVDQGSAEMILQKNLSPELLIDTIFTMWQNKTQYLTNAKKIRATLPHDGTKALVHVITKILNTVHER